MKTLPKGAPQTSHSLVKPQAKATKARFRQTKKVAASLGLSSAVATTDRMSDADIENKEVAMKWTAEMTRL